jgi:hypothetical protein
MESENINSSVKPTVTFYRVYSNAIAPMRADKAALGGLPVTGYRHCEPLRSASGFGWYIFPPEKILLRFNGVDIFYSIDNSEWQVLSSISLPGFNEYWNEHAPQELKDLAPPFLTRVPVRGVVQIWSGLLCATKDDWSVHVRPLANTANSHLYSCFEGIVESDRYQPFPLFINIQLLATDVEIELPKTYPLFQIQPLLRDCYTDEGHIYEEHVGLETSTNGTPTMTDENWLGYRKTIRVDMPDEAPQSGEYTVSTRKRAKSD